MPYIDSFSVGNVVYDMRDKYAGLYTADAYSNSATYAVGDMVTNDGKLYKCNTPIPVAEEWTPAHWTEITLAEETAELNADISKISEQSKNLLPVNGIGTVSIRNVSAQYEDGVLTLSGTATANGGRAVRIITPIELPAGVYTFSADKIRPVYIESVDGDTILGRADIINPYNTFELTQTTSVYLGFNVSNNVVYDEKIKIQLESGNVKTIYTKPSSMSAIDVYARNNFLEKSKNILPNEYKQTTVLGANVLYNNGHISITGTATANGGRNIPIITSFILKQGTYTLSKINSVHPTFLQTGTTILAQLDSANSVTFTTTEDLEVFISINVTNGSVYNVEYDVQVESGVNATPIHTPSFETYIDYVARENLALIEKNAIAPVLSSMIADTALVTNDFRIVNNQLYRITTNVPLGSTLIPGTNCTATSITAILKSLLS